MLKDKSVLKDKKFYGAAHNWRLEFVALDFAINQKTQKYLFVYFLHNGGKQIQAG